MNNSSKEKICAFGAKNEGRIISLEGRMSNLEGMTTENHKMLKDLHQVLYVNGFTTEVAMNTKFREAWSKYKYGVLIILVGLIIRGFWT